MRNSSRHPNTLHALLCVLTATAALLISSASASARCFSVPNLRTPDLEKAAGFLTNGSEGQRVIQAVAQGNVETVRTLIAADPTLLSTMTVLPERTRPYSGNAADLLSVAVARCDAAMVQTLLEMGADPNGAIAGLALTYAILADDPALAVALLDAGASPDAHAPRYSPPMHEALMFENTEGIALLASYGADVNRADDFGGLFLGTALRTGNWDAAKVLMDAGANPWQVGIKGALPAYWIYTSEPRGRSAKRIHDDLLGRVRAQAPIWPPPNSAEVSRNFLDGTWPTADMRVAGFEAGEGAMRSMRAASR